MSKSIFSDFVDDTFLKSLRKYERPSCSSTGLNDYFYIGSSNQKGKFYKYYFEQRDQFIFCKKEKSSEAFAFMDVLYAQMKKSKPQEIDGKICFGIKLIKKRTYEELYTNDEQIFQIWYLKLKQFVVLTKFRTHFQTVGVLGKGSFAKVYEVKRINDSKNFAVKVFNKLKIQNEEDKKGLINEIEIMRSLKHPNLIQIDEVYEGENYVYCLGPVYKGQNLYQALCKKGPQPESKVITIAEQLLRGIQYLHKKDIIHRDIKPENIMLKDEKKLEIVLIDVGFSVNKDEFHAYFSRCGTPGYLAPEVLKNNEYDTSVDIYSCGVVLYFLLSGVNPFKGENYHDVVSKNTRSRISFDSLKKLNVSKPTINLLKKMLKSDPSKRISVNDALKDQCFEEIQSQSPLIKSQEKVFK